MEKMSESRTSELAGRRLLRLFRAAGITPDFISPDVLAGLSLQIDPTIVKSIFVISN
jgi:hypothetical protein